MSTTTSSPPSRGRSPARHSRAVNWKKARRVFRALLELIGVYIAIICLIQGPFIMKTRVTHILPIIWFEPKILALVNLATSAMYFAHWACPHPLLDCIYKLLVTMGGWPASWVWQKVWGHRSHSKTMCLVGGVSLYAAGES